MTDSIADCAKDIAEHMEGAARIFRLQGRIRPLLGGVFGAGEFSLMSHSFVKSGLDCVWFAVVHTDSRFPLVSIKETQAEAIAEARARICRQGRRTLLLILGAAARIVEQNELARVKAVRAARDAEIGEEGNEDQGRSKRKVHSIPRRRRSIFEQSGGKCFYCKCDIELAGTWHIEHMMPRALGGDDKPSNLVASCAPCNFKKRDRTADEFITGQAAQVQA